MQYNIIYSQSIIILNHMQLINHIIYALELFMIICAQKSAPPPKAAHATAGSIIPMSAHNLSTFFCKLELLI